MEEIYLIKTENYIFEVITKQTSNIFKNNKLNSIKIFKFWSINSKLNKLSPVGMELNSPSIKSIYEFKKYNIYEILKTSLANTIEDKDKLEEVTKPFLIYQNEIASEIFIKI